MVLQSLEKVIFYISDKVIMINENIYKTMNFPKNSDKTFTHVTKVVAPKTGPAGLSESILCQDVVCAFVSAVDVCC